MATTAEVNALRQAIGIASRQAGTDIEAAVRTIELLVNNQRIGIWICDAIIDNLHNDFGSAGRRRAYENGFESGYDEGLNAGLAATVSGGASRSAKQPKEG